MTEDKERKLPTTPEECPFFERCGAGICPLDNEGVWYSNEEICKNDDFSNLLMVKVQKLLKKYKAEGMFTSHTLKEIQRVRRTTKGVKVE